ncbi:MAG: response regulator transcription factor [Planctomycetota bacterium]|jgi:DNA-binding NarL/FixJ family response regulator
MAPGNNKSPDAGKRLDSNRVRILIVDDHPIFRRGLVELIAEESDLEVCGEAADPLEALRCAETAAPDLVIVDLSLREGHGIDLIEQIKRRDEQIKMIVCSMHEESRFAERALRAGALGYVNKQDASEKLIDAIHRVLKGEIYVSSRVAKRLLHSFVGVESSNQDPLDALTGREMEVFQMIGQGLTTKTIARRLQLSPKTVEAHRGRIKTKLGLSNSVALSHRAFQWVHEQR